MDIRGVEERGTVKENKMKMFFLLTFFSFMSPRILVMDMFPLSLSSLHSCL